MTCRPFAAIDRTFQALAELEGHSVVGIVLSGTGNVILITHHLPNAEDPQLQFDIIDTGAGISDEQAVKLFHPFVSCFRLGMIVSNHLEETLQSLRGFGTITLQQLDRLSEFHVIVPDLWQHAHRSSDDVHKLPEVVPQLRNLLVFRPVHRHRSSALIEHRKQGQLVSIAH